jgi:secretion/DNA translocation related TadE-like protein
VSARGRDRHGRGSASVLVAGLVGVLVLLGGAALLVAGFAVAHHRARAAADLAAVSGATAFVQGEDACRQARRSARDNGAAVLSCEQVGDQVDYVVTVRVSVPARTRVPGLPDTVEALAHAGSAP